MIYVSSSCVKAKTIADSVRILANEGFKNIELSGGTEPYSELENDLLRLKEEFGISYLCHNYFPPPEVPFVLNLASLEEDVAIMSFEHCKRAIELSQKLGADQFAFHAGFLINIPLDQIGKKISNRELFDRKQALDQFHSYLRSLIEIAAQDVKLYIENNVLSLANYTEFQEKDPFFFTHSSNLEEARSDTGIGYLLDLAHLRVSSTVLGLNFQNEVANLIDGTDYIHLSGNDGQADLNWELTEESDIFQSLQSFDLSSKTITLETYVEMDKIKRTHQLISGLL